LGFRIIDLTKGLALPGEAFFFCAEYLPAPDFTHPASHLMAALFLPLFRTFDNEATSPG